MELLLNALWLLVSLSALSWCAWRNCTSSECADRNALRTIVAVCLLALFLFPVISATDDLHPAQAMVEEPAAKKLVSLTHGLITATAAPPVFSLIVLLLLLLSLGNVVGRVFEDTPVAFSTVLSNRLKGRAPPEAAL